MKIQYNTLINALSLDHEVDLWEIYFIDSHGDITLCDLSIQWGEYRAIFDIIQPGFDGGFWGSPI